MPNTAVRRDNGIPGSNAEKRVEEMGGPIAKRASRKTTDESANSKAASRRTTNEPAIIDLKTRSWSDDDDVQAAVEEPPDADVNMQDWTPPRTTLRERRQRLAEQQQRQRTATEDDEFDIPRRRRTTDDITPRRRSAGKPQTDQLPRERRHVHWVVPVCIGMLLLVALYTVCFWVYLLGLGVSNRMSYGPTMTSETSAVLGQSDSRANPSDILASNIGGRIVVTILPGGDTTKALVYQLPALEPSMWGNLADVVATIDVQPHSATPNIYVHLVGNPDYWHFFARPSLTVTLLNMKQGFKIVLGSQ